MEAMPGMARRNELRERVEDFVAPERPLMRPTPRSAMFFPVVVLVAVLPGLYALRSWDLNPPGPWWGLRGLAVLEGRYWDQAAAPLEAPEPEARSYRAVALQPPLYAWLEAGFLALSPHYAPVATVLPSYLAGALVIVLVYAQGRLWGGPGLGLVAAVLTGFNRDLLVQMQQATPTTLGLAGALASLHCYSRHLVAREEARAWWVMLGGLTLGLSLLAVGGFGLLVVPVVILHQAAIGRRLAVGRRAPPWWQAGWGNPSMRAGGLALLIALAMAAPWHWRMFQRYGSAFVAALLAPPQTWGAIPHGLRERLLELAPALLPLGLYAAARALRRAIASRDNEAATIGGSLWLAWLAGAAVAPELLTRGPRPAMNLFLLVPLNLMAAQAITELANRRIPARSLLWLAPASSAAWAWSFSPKVRAALMELIRAPRPDPAANPGVNLTVAVVVVLVVATWGLGRWARRRDARTRWVLGTYLCAVMAATVATGIREVRFRHRETSDLLALREIILRRDQARPFRVLAVVGPDPAASGSMKGLQPGGRLRFILRTSLPHLSQLDLARVGELEKLPNGQCLVVLVGTRERLSYAVQSRLSLEAIHPGRAGILGAFATAPDGGRSVRR